MAEAIVSFVVERLGDLLIQEALFLHGVSEQVRWVQTELKRIQCFLKDADARQDGNEGIRQWVSEMRDGAYDAEDVIETFIFKDHDEEGGDGQKKRGFMARVKSCACFLNKQVNLHNVGKEIEDIKNRILDLSRNTETYCFRDVNVQAGTSHEHQRLRDLRRSSPRPDEHHIVGLEDDAKAIGKQLNKGEPRRFVVSIVGMGGLGKSTLARKVYNYADIMHPFDCHAWVYVSAEYTIKDVLQRMIKSFKNPSREALEIMDKLTEEDLEAQLHEFLKQRRYLVVIDDVWSINAWDSLRRALPDNGKRSRVILTTRNRKVAPGADERSIVHELRILSEEESWDLFCRKTFPSFYNNDVVDGRGGPCPPNLQSLGRMMVGKCGGLPLAIIVLGGLLLTKLPQEWQRVHDHIGQKLMKDEKYRLTEILSLSYNDLPYQLKSCFLYVGLFPEDSEIETRRLIRLWIAEGFILRQEERMEDIAEDYLNELINRSMIQIVSRNWNQRVSKCRVHDLLRDISISKAKEENFFDVYQGNTNSPPPSANSRRHVAHSGIIRYFSIQHSNPHVRSLLLFNPDGEFLQPYHWKSIYPSFKLLRVLELNNITLFYFPNEIGNLIHLRYLGMDIGSIPTSIGNLVMLRTLKVSDTRSTLPDVIWKMKQLRYLSAKIQEPLRFDTLEELQTLKTIRADIWIKCCSVNLNSLRKLKIEGIISSHGEAVFDSISKYSSSLQSLSLMTEHDEDPLPTLTPLGRCHNLYKLRLRGKIERLPDKHHEFPLKLTCLILVYSMLQHDPMPILSKLPNLTNLALSRHSYEGREMVCSEKGFPQLQYLELDRLSELREWIVEKGSMPSLCILFIIRCEKLMMIPEGLRFITTLKELEIRNMSEEFERRIKGEDRHKIEHIPSISIRVL